MSCQGFVVTLPKYLQTTVESQDVAVLLWTPHGCYALPHCLTTHPWRVLTAYLPTSKSLANDNLVLVD